MARRRIFAAAAVVAMVAGASGEAAGGSGLLGSAVGFYDGVATIQNTESFLSSSGMDSHRSLLDTGEQAEEVKQITIDHVSPSERTRL